MVSRLEGIFSLHPRRDWSLYWSVFNPGKGIVFIIMGGSSLQYWLQWNVCNPPLVTNFMNFINYRRRQTVPVKSLEKEVGQSLGE